MDLTDSDIINTFKLFIRDRWADQFEEMYLQYPDTTSLYIDYWALINYNGIFEDLIDNNPVRFFKCTKIAIHEYDLPVDVDLTSVTVRIGEYPFETPIRKIRHTHIMKTVSVTGIVRRVTDVRPKFSNVAFECLRCGHIMYIPQVLKKMIEPMYCENETCGKKGPWSISYQLTEFVDFQILEIQEPFENLEGSQPRNLVIHVYDDLVDIVTAGDKIKVTGVLNISQKMSKEGKATVSDIVLESNTIEKLDKSYSEIDISEEDENEIIKLSKNENIKLMISSSIAPSIYGYDDIKSALALQLFSGVAKDLPDGVRIRGDIHVMLVGDPGTAKSQLVRYITALSPRGVFNSGKSASGVGLTAAVVKDNLSDDRWTLEGGALVLADNGLCAVDEMDKMRQEDVSALHEAMEQQTVTISKAGIHAVLSTRCALLAAANPVHGRFDEYDSDIAGQINMSPTLLSRFDLIFIIPDKPNEERDLHIAEHISNNHIVGGLLKNNLPIPSTNDISSELISKEMLRKYVTYSRTNINPMLTRAAQHRIQNFYVQVRLLNVENNTIPITARKIDGIYRLAEASAKMRLSKEVTLDDANDAIYIVIYCLKQMNYNTDDTNMNMFEVGETQSQRNRIKKIQTILQSNDEIGFDALLDIIKCDENVLQSTLTKLKRNGLILITGDKLYKWVG